MNHPSKAHFFDALREVVGSGRVLTSHSTTQHYRTGIRVGGGAACAVVLPTSLLQIWQLLQICVDHDKIIIMQAANTGVTAGSTPDGDDYDRDVVIINTLKIDDLILLNQGEQVLAFAGSTLYQLESKLKPLSRTPHSIIGSSCIGASVVGGVCNNSGGNLVNRGPAYTELSLYAQLTAKGELQLVNNLGIELGETPQEIFTNLASCNFDPDAIPKSNKKASDDEYQQRVRDIKAPTPARFNADKRRLFQASGCAGKLAVFVVRLDTFAEPAREEVFYVGTNDPKEFTDIRKHILTHFKHLPEMGEYMHRGYFDASDKYCKDTFLFIKYFGSAFLPKLFAFKSWVDGFLNKVPFLPRSLVDRFLQFSASIWPDHLPKSMRDYRDQYEHHLIIKSNDGVIEETKALLEDFYKGQRAGAFFVCTKKEADSALLHRFVAGGAGPRYCLMHSKDIGGMLPFDIALRRDDDHWHDLLPNELLDQLAAPLILSHFFCLVLHHDFVLKKGVAMDEFKDKYLKLLDARGAKYPAEHNVGHLYKAEPNLAGFYQSLDPTNSFNAGVGKMSKYRDYSDEIIENRS